MTRQGDHVGQLLKVAGLRLPFDAPEGEIRKALPDFMGIDPARIVGATVLRRALDARGRGRPVNVYTLGVELTPGPDQEGFLPWEGQPTPPLPIPGAERITPIVVGAGPAGLFAAARLTTLGFRPLLFERGKPIEERGRDVAAYWKSGIPDPETNVQFGEGGAGAFSDGKLTSRSKDARKSWVLEKLVEAGAPGSILYDAKPHLGTDRLRPIVRALRRMLLANGASIRFGERVEELTIREDRVLGILTDKAKYAGAPVFLATGHSARDLYRALATQGVALSPKGFAVGVRVELSQVLVDKDRYGAWAGSENLPHAEFSLATKASDGRGVYSFCMCPGGVVIPASTEPDGLVLNGMSGSRRSSAFANGALVVEVRPRDFGDSPLGGLSFQEKLERSAFLLAGRRAVPAMGVGAFLGEAGENGVERSNCPWPLVKRDLTLCLPGFVTKALREVMPSLVRELYPLRAGTLLGVETRTSSPVRIDRHDDGQALNHRGLYPIGEGAGYAGGIISSAIDGVRAVDSFAAAFRGE